MKGATTALMKPHNLGEGKGGQAKSKAGELIGGDREEIVQTVVSMASTCCLNIALYLI